MKTSPLFLIGFLTCIPFLGRSEPLGTIPVIVEGEPKIEIDFESDVWTSPYQNKETPQRLYQVQMKVPLFKKNSQRASLTMGGEGRSVGQPDLTIGEDQVRVGQDLRSQSIGLAFDAELGEESLFQFFSSYDSASDEPYREQRDISVALAAAYTTSRHESRQWIFGVDRSENRGIGNGQVWPYVGIVYHLKNGAKITAGFPFFLFQWGGEPSWSMQFRASALGIDAQYVKYFWPKLSVWVRSGLANRSYSHINRVRDERRLIYEEKFAEAGFRILLSEQTTFGLNLGYSFERKLFEGERVFSPIGEVHSIDPDFYAGLKMEYYF